MMSPRLGYQTGQRSRRDLFKQVRAHRAGTQMAEFRTLTENSTKLRARNSMLGPFCSEVRDNRANFRQNMSNFRENSSEFRHILSEDGENSSELRENNLKVR
jgi:hypothetical protein